ncbi:Repeat domain-containing protein [Desulfuromusa kysingii]|uniref:Repeat domain-containing protein n=1 Tax=Desulfuromusa kysingii TaxID=37625 RepID=A0A1H4CNR8_9BACT|nr:VCBS repeat-containing protein [Desulfuromusa kysingii]SEA61958.1 Repeat domain-containing protein [Desulfuromusa kysingii]
MKLVARLSLILILCFPLTSLAQIPEQIKNDFAPVSGTIIMPIGEEYLVDLDASSNLQVGDILTLIQSGEKVIHPVTKETLGTLELAKGFLQVTQIKSGYSYVKLLSAEMTPQKGDQLKRFTQTPTRFEFSQPADRIAAELKMALPQLNWLSDHDTTEPELIFHLADDKLQVTNSADVVLRQYPYRDGKLTSSLAVAPPKNNLTLQNEEKSLLNKTVGSLTSAIGIKTKDKRLENPGIVQSQNSTDGSWVGADIDGNPVGITVADFDGDGLLEIAVATEKQLRILRKTDSNLTQVATVNFSVGVRLLSLDSLDLDSDGIPELYLTAHSDTKLSSQVVKYINGDYQTTINQVPWFFRVVNLAGMGKLLLGQTLGDLDTPFSEQPFRVEYSEGKLVKGDNINLPNTYDPFSLTTISGINDELFYAEITSQDTLHITSLGGETAWKSDDHYGGTETFFYNVEETESVQSTPINIQKRLISLTTGELLVVKNEGFRLFERYHDYDQSRVIAFTWDNTSLNEKWRTPDVKGYIADFSVADADNDGQDELVTVINYKKDFFIQNGRSSVVIYELNQ